MELRERLLVESGKDEFTLVPRQLTNRLEDSFVSRVEGQVILGGTLVMKSYKTVTSYFGYFYRGAPHALTSFTTGPDFMKDIRAVQLADGHVEYFSHHKTNSSCLTGFITVERLVDTTQDITAAAQPH